jgi:hypothetical protein
VADVQLDELRQRQNRLHVQVDEPVVSDDLVACFIGKAGGLDEACKISIAGCSPGLGIGTGVKFDDRSAE